ncbi:hypothetical protein GCM10010294_70990 [Streptomyces griseoloalbus]|nr:hypothetical protein GCM10010294_70990 [Streptomyces griseoloalbus]
MEERAGPSQARRARSAAPAGWDASTPLAKTVNTRGRSVHDFRRGPSQARRARSAALAGWEASTPLSETVNT